MDTSGTRKPRVRNLNSKCTPLLGQGIRYIRLSNASACPREARFGFPVKPVEDFQCYECGMNRRACVTHGYWQSEMLEMKSKALRKQSENRRRKAGIPSSVIAEVQMAGNSEASVSRAW